MNYLIASGWWSCEADDDQRDKLFGDEAIRDAEFHNLWRECIDRFAQAAEIMVVDSASPKKPSDVSSEKWLEMSKNFGHATTHDGKYSGYTRAIFISMMYAYANDFDYWVYIEQDALIYGKGIIEKSIAESTKGVIYGSGSGTPQQIQQSFMIFHKSEIPSFISNYTSIEATDSTISPEWKFLFSKNSLAHYMPEILMKWITNKSKNRHSDTFRRFLIKFVRYFDNFDTFKFGFGRARPIKFSDPYFYFQHGKKEELADFKNKIRKI